MRLRKTFRRSRGDDPVFAWAFRYALAAVVVGAGMLLIGPSPGVGWALIVFGGWLATLTSGPATRPQSEAARRRGRVGLSSVASTRPRPPNPTRARSTARGRGRPRSRDPRPIARAEVVALRRVSASWHFGARGDLPLDRLRPHRRPPAAQLYHRQPEAPQLSIIADTDQANHPRVASS
jgi:hypothetical protein